jgi:hypothetical protein
VSVQARRAHLSILGEANARWTPRKSGWPGAVEGKSHVRYMSGYGASDDCTNTSSVEVAVEMTVDVLVSMNDWPDHLYRATLYDLL